MSSKDEHVRAMRWLYDDEHSYRKAAAKLKLEELKAKKEKQLIRQYRKRQRRIWLQRAETAVGPAVQKLKKQAKQVSRKQLAYGVATLVAIGVIWSGFQMFGHNKSNYQKKTLGAATVTPDFKPAVPQDGSQKVTATENNHHKIVTYQDSIAGSNLIVSQQKLPDNFKSDPEAITKLDQFKAAEALDTTKGKLYITTNDTGQQWAAITYPPDVLIFFKTNQKISSENWYKYIKDLEVK